MRSTSTQSLYVPGSACDRCIVPAHSHFLALPEALSGRPKSSGTVDGLPGRFESHVNNSARPVAPDCVLCEQLCEHYPKKNAGTALSHYGPLVDMEPDGLWIGIGSQFLGESCTPYLAVEHDLRSLRLSKARPA